MLPHQPPPPERTGQRLTSLFFSCLLGPSAAERGPCGPDPQLEGRGVSQLPRRQHPRRRWVRGSAHPAPGPGRGGAGRSPPPAGPSSPPLLRPALAAVTAACRKLGAGSWAGSAGWAACTGSAAAAGESLGWRRGARREADQDPAVGEPPGASTRMSRSRLWGPLEEHREVEEEPGGGESTCPRCWGVQEPLKARQRVRNSKLGRPETPSWRTRILRLERSPGVRNEGCSVGLLGAPSAGRRGAEPWKGVRREEARGGRGGRQAPGRGAPDSGGWGDASDFSGKGWRGFRREGGRGERSCVENPGFCSGGWGVGKLERRGGGPRWPAEL